MRDQRLHCEGPVIERLVRHCEPEKDNEFIRDSARSKPSLREAGNINLWSRLPALREAGFGFEEV